MSDYIGGASGDTGVPIGFPLANEPLLAPTTESALQVCVTLDMLHITTAPDTPIALYDITGQLLLQSQSDADGLCDIPLVALTEGLYIVATPAESVKCLIP